MSTDSLSRALQSRRGNSLDPSMMQMPVDQAPGQMVLPPAAPQPMGDSQGHKEIDAKEGLHENPQILQQDHVEEHIPVMGEKGAPPVAPSLDDEMRDAVTDNATQMQYQQMQDQGSRPRSLGERAKMMALKDKYDMDGKK